MDKQKNELKTTHWLKNKEYQNILMYFIFVIISSVLFLLLHFLFTEVGNYDVSFTQYAPMLAFAILILIRRQDKSMLIDIKDRCKVDLKSIFYSLAIAIALVGIFVAVNYVLFALGDSFSKWQTPSIVLSLIFIMIGCITEEIGWRGYLLPTLNRKFSLLISSIIVGVFWGVWHLNFSEGIVGFFVYTLFITTLSIIMSWVQAKNSFKLLPAILFHFFINLFCRLFLFGRIGWQAYLLLAAFFIAIGIILFIVDKEAFLSKTNNSSNKSVQS